MLNWLTDTLHHERPVGPRSPPEPPLPPDSSGRFRQSRQQRGARRRVVFPLEERGNEILQKLHGILRHVPKPNVSLIWPLVCNSLAPRVKCAAARPRRSPHHPPLIILPRRDTRLHYLAIMGVTFDKTITCWSSRWMLFGNFCGSRMDSPLRAPNCVMAHEGQRMSKDDWLRDSAL